MNLVPSRTHEIADRRVYVYDQVFPPEVVRNFANVVLQLSFRRRESFDRELSVGIDKEKFRQAPFLWPVTETLFESVAKRELGVTDPSVSFSHTYAAAMGPGSCGTLHRDIDSSDSVTFLYYANLVWRGEWGGETVFYDQHLDAVAAVTPKPGRLVMFHSNLFHRAGVPHPDTPTYRYTVSVFYCPYRESVEGKESTERFAAPQATDSLHEIGRH
ncbi:MAG TPA: 2OG-Fe(II) oxygenase [Thermoanaerobaculia bacterium]|nr:2OG-Fe(II) oxygenase [Thermoanaerobaculia bacterium]